tara:strand:+ start:213 stop:491 length:279 start_codon:yes stop_codon:yes gene_type:complete
MLLADGFEKAFIGISQRCGQPTLAVYDKNMCLQILIDDGMDMDEAIEYFDFNVEGAWVGEDTPFFLNKMPLKDYFELYDYKEHSNDNQKETK